MEAFICTFNKLNVGTLSSIKLLLGHQPLGGADAPVQEICLNLHWKQHGSQVSGSVDCSIFPLLAPLAKHPDFLNMIKSVSVDM